MKNNFRVDHALAFFKALNTTSKAGIDKSFELDIGPELMDTLCRYAEDTFNLYGSGGCGVANALILIGYALRVSEERTRPMCC